jgi:hypothetical protein
MSSASGTFPSAFVRFVRWDEKPLKKSPFQVKADKEHCFLISAHPKQSSAGPFEAVCINIETGAVHVISLTKVGAATPSYLWLGTIPAKTLCRNAEFLVRVAVPPQGPACEMEIYTA